MTLKRSSVSFRRQGSSGRIWSDRHIIGPETGLPPNAAAAAAAGDGGHDDQENDLPGNGSSGEFYASQKDEIHHHHPQPTNFEATPEPENNVPGNPKQEESKASHPQQKVQRCGISVLFGRCMGPTTTA